MSERAGKRIGLRFIGRLRQATSAPNVEHRSEAFHHSACELEECPSCHGRFQSCDCEKLSEWYAEFEEEDPRDRLARLIAHVGLWPWWVEQVPSETRRLLAGDMGAAEQPPESFMVSSGITPYTVLNELSRLSREAGDVSLSTRLRGEAERRANPIEVHWLLDGRIDEHYKNRERDPGALAQAIQACWDQIAWAPSALAAYRAAGYGALSAHRGYRQLAILAEKRGDFEEAIRLASEARAQGWLGDWDKRIARCQQRLRC